MEIKDNKIKLTDQEHDNFSRFMGICQLFSSIQGLSESLNKIIDKYTKEFTDREMLKEVKAEKGVVSVRIMIDGIINNLDYLAENLDTIEKEIREEIQVFQKLHPFPGQGMARPTVQPNKSGIIVPNKLH